MWLSLDPHGEFHSKTRTLPDIGPLVHPHFTDALLPWKEGFSTNNLELVVSVSVFGFEDDSYQIIIGVS